MKRRGRAAVAVVCLSMFVLVTPTLVLCKSADGHAAVEPMTSVCCLEGAFGGDGVAPVSPAEGAIANACGDACDDTFLITSVNVTSFRPLVQRCDAVAVAPDDALASCRRSAPALSRAQPWPPPPTGDSRRPTVLRI